MKRMVALFAALILAMELCACTAIQPEGQGTEASQGPTWQEQYQEQYDLGVRYLFEGNYQEAILAFTAAIEIDPKRAPAYVGRGDAYIGLGETEENLAAAMTDYEKAIELDETSAEAYLGLADVYIRQGDYQKALEVLRRGLERTDNQAVKSKLHEVGDASIFAERTDKNGLNSHGVTAFFRRDEYISFETLATEEQKFIEQAVNAIIQEDRDALLALNRAGSDIIQTHGKHLYTTWENYKIELREYNLGAAGVEEESHEEYSWAMQIRPQYGNGYDVQVYTAQLVDASKISTSTSSYRYYLDITDIAICPCIDWQWNGELTAYRLAEDTQIGLSGSRDTRNAYLTTGKLVDSLREGEFIINTEYLSEDTETHIVDNYTDQYTERYFDGKCVETSPGSTRFAGGGYVRIDGADIGSSLGEEGLESLYW